ncbi:hypothetical protein RIF29_03350 [Crotalaria pallida]|uniref:Uncharacterized protein n=1 Tax=Crotalaria pallida TaxID=3830 RepID=A0AAN9J025_CROPI
MVLICGIYGFEHCYFNDGVTLLSTLHLIHASYPLTRTIFCHNKTKIAVFLSSNYVIIVNKFCLRLVFQLSLLKSERKKN